MGASVGASVGAAVAAAVVGAAVAAAVVAAKVAAAVAAAVVGAAVQTGAGSYYRFWTAMTQKSFGPAFVCIFCGIGSDLGAFISLMVCFLTGLLQYNVQVSMFRSHLGSSMC